MAERFTRTAWAKARRHFCGGTAAEARPGYSAGLNKQSDSVPADRNTRETESVWKLDEERDLEPKRSRASSKQTDQLPELEGPPRKDMKGAGSRQ